MKKNILTEDMVINLMDGKIAGFTGRVGDVFVQGRKVMTISEHIGPVVDTIECSDGFLFAERESF